MNGIALDDPGVAIDAGAFVPPALHGVGINANDQRVERFAIGHKRRNIDIDRVIPRPVAVNQSAIQPDRRMCRNAVQLQFDVLAAVGWLKPEEIAIPGDATLAITLRQIFVLVRQLKAGKIVGEGNGHPVRVVIGRRCCAPCRTGFRIGIGPAVAHDLRERHIAFEESPAFIKRQDIPNRRLTADRRGWGMMRWRRLCADHGSGHAKGQDAQ